MKTVRVNITTAVNNAAIRKDKRNGRDIIIVPSATLPDNIIMNGIKYPADEIAASYKSLDRTPAPYGHPMVGNYFVSASDPEGINEGWIGAWNENVRQVDGRVLIDKVIDVEVANRSDNGKAVLNAIENGDPIHTSTGLNGELDDPDGDDHDSIIRNMVFDHDAILLNEEGAATPDQGVGMMVNAAGEELDVINSTFLESADRHLDWAVDDVVRALESRQRAGVMERMKTAILDALSSGRITPQTNESEDTMDDAKFNELSEKVNALTEAQAGISEAITNAVTSAVAPLVEAQAELVANAKAADEAELAGLVEKIVKANLLDEETAGELTLNAARKLAEKAAPKKAAALNSGFNPDSGDADEFADVDLNAALKEDV